MSNFSFLNISNQSHKDELEIIEKMGMKSAITDFSILLGGDYSNEDFAIGSKSLKNRAGEYWSTNFTENNLIKTITFMGTLRERNMENRNIGARILLPYKELPNTLKKQKAEITSSIVKVEYGYYPQYVASSDIQTALEAEYNNESLEATNNIYTVDLQKHEDLYKEFNPTILQEYQYKGKKYVRVTANMKNNYAILSNGKTYYNGNQVWVEVEPIVWLVDEKAKVMLTEKIMFSGIRFDKTQNSEKRDFNKTEIKNFIDNYWSKEIIQDEELVFQEASEYRAQSENEQENINTRKKNPYGFIFGKVSEEDIIKGALQSNISVFLHGRSSEGKSARVKQFDPECEILYLRNLTPEGLNGKSVYNQATGDMIDIKPTWLQKLEAKCEKEKDKIHIVFLDEITNALPSIQGMAFNIVLDREVNGKWKLPENARIAAAGNDLSDSLSANELSEPLFNRFAHVYIETTAQDWLEWAAKPKQSYEKLDYEKEEEQAKIHPSVYAYVAYKSSKGDDVLRTPYDGKKPNADPRKWEMASKVLYRAKQPEMLRALIGEELTKDFTQFCKQQAISIEDVLNNNYKEQDLLEMNVSEKYATAVGLSAVGEDNVEKVRDFVAIMGEEILSTFDNLWARGSEKRLEKIAELKMIKTQDIA